MTTKSIFFCVVFFAMMSCSGSIPEPTPAQIDWANSTWQNTTAETLQRGRTLYITKCSGCHSVITPTSVSSDKWLEILPGMFKKSKVESAESELIKKYLLTVTKQSNLPEGKSNVQKCRGTADAFQGSYKNE